jgi:DNA repair protein RecO (recombination protein O)
MPAKESEAIVLRTFPLGEGDRLVSFLDRNFGRMRGVAKGAKLPKSRFGSTLEVLAHIRIWYFERETRDLVRISQCELIESFLDVQKDYASAVALSLISEITEAVLGEREVADPQYRLLLLTARAVRTYGPIPAVLAYFTMWTARLGGWLGKLDRCERCGSQVMDQDMFVAPGRAGFLCVQCRDQFSHKVTAAALKVSRDIVAGPLAGFMSTAPAIGPTVEILGYTLDLLEYHMEKRLISRPMLGISK